VLADHVREQLAQRPLAPRRRQVELISAHRVDDLDGPPPVFAGSVHGMSITISVRYEYLPGS